MGGEIPGYEITESHVVMTRRIGGPTGDINEGKEAIDLAHMCKQKHGGRALVNLRYIFSVGEVSFSDGGKGIRTISPGVYFLIYADCVTGVRKK